MDNKPNPRVRTHRDLIIWQKSMLLVNAIYDLTEPFPKREDYGLTAQMRRAAVSIPANIAEGQGRNTTRDFLRFLSIARGSFRERDTYCEVSRMRKYATDAGLQIIDALMDEVGRLHTALCAALRRRPH